MPKVSDAHRESRRAQILAAALACFGEKGFQRTSMADIIKSSGLSAGAIYLHFGSKQEIVLSAGREVLSRRLGALAVSGDGPTPDPVEVMRGLLSGMVDDLLDTRVLVQLWGEATADAEMLGLVREIFGALRDAWVGYLSVWGAQRKTPDPAAWAHTAWPAVLALAQGFFVQRALAPDFDADAYFASVRATAGPGLLIP
jgi:TetR/AcrR family transcriptional regulator, transcriptional repressor of aconitase